MYSDNPGGSRGGYSSRAGSSAGPNRTRPRDVKSRTMQKYTVYDEDVGSRYEFDDDEPVLTRGGGRGGSQQQARSGPQSQLPVRIHSYARQDNRIIRSMAGTSHGRRDIVHKIIVKNVSRPAKELHRILSLLGESLDGFRPIAPRVASMSIEFYLTRQEHADAVRSMTMRISDKSGRRLQIVALRTAAPWEALKPETKQLIEEVVRERYLGSLNSLDLAAFSTDQKFTNRNIHCPLFNNAVLVHVSSVISRDYGHIRGLSLKDNHLRSLDYVSTLVYCAPRVTELDLSSNILTRIELLDVLRGWPIEKLHLENNELIEKLFGSADASASAYTSAVHGIFPRVNYLDGITVNPQSSPLDSDELLGSTANLLPYRSGYHTNEQLRELVETFLLQYFSLYDGRDGEQTRKKLMDAYDDSAIFTFGIHYLPGGGRCMKGDEAAFQNYIRSSHNIIQEQKWQNYREKIVFKGSMDIAVELSKLPLSVHIKESFILDFNLVSESLISFTLHGILRDGKDAFNPEGECKFFTRNFVVVPKQDNTLAIVSDMLGLTPIAVDRLERYNNLIKKAAAEAITDQMGTAFVPSSSGGMMAMNGGMAMPPVSMPPPPPTPQPIVQPFAAIAPPVQQPQPIQTMTAPQPATAAPAYNVNDPAIQRAMVEQFSAISGMKEEWSQKCLIDMNWDFEAAGQVFTQMRASIPAEAFK